MNNSQPPEWSKQFLNWLNRQPRWMVAVGVLLVLVIGALLLSDVSSSDQTIPGVQADPSLNSTALALGVFFRLILVVAAIYIAAILVRRWQSGGLKRPDRQLAVLETLHLSQRRAVYLIRAGEQVFLVGATDQSINLLGEVPPSQPGSVAHPAANGLSFDQQLSLASQKDDPTEDLQ